MKVPQVKQPELDIHPQGTFVASFIGFGEIKLSQGGFPYMTGKFKTDHGEVCASFVGSLDTISLLTRLQPELHTRSFHVRVGHKKYQDVIYAVAVVKLQEL